MTRFDSLYSSFARPALEHQFGESSDITYITRRTDASGDAVDTEYTIEGAIKREVTEAEQPLGNVGQSAITVVWSIATSELTAEGITPQQGDAIQDANGVNWTIKGWKETGLQTQYDFTCEKGLV